MFKRVLSILFVICIILNLVGCGEASPSKVVSKFLDAYKANDSETVSEVYMGILENPEGDTKVSSILFEKMREFDYDIASETISDSGETATVEVKITAYELAEAFPKIFSELFLNGSDLKNLKEPSEKEMEDVTLKYFKNVEKTYIKNLEIPLVKIRGTWYVNDKIDEEFRDAISGGLTTIQESFNFN